LLKKVLVEAKKDLFFWKKVLLLEKKGSATGCSHDTLDRERWRQIASLFYLNLLS